MPEGTVQEEGLLASAWRWYSTKREAAKRWVRDHTGALGRKLFSPSSNTAREQDIQLAFQGRSEADAARDYNQRRRIGEGVQQVSGDVAAAGGEIAAEGVIQYAEAQVAGTVVGGVVQGAGRARQAVRNTVKGAEETIELEVQAGRRAAAAEAGAAKRADDAIAVGGETAPASSRATRATPWGSRDVPTGKFTRGARGGIDPVDDFVAQAQANGYEVVGREVTFKTPFGDRRADVLLRDPRTGKISGVEVKSTLEEFNKFNAQQNAADRYINRFGARAAGEKAKDIGVTSLDSMTKILWEAPKQ